MYSGSSVTQLHLEILIARVPPRHHRVGCWMLVSWFLPPLSIAFLPSCLLFPHDRDEGLRRDHGNVLVVLQRQKVFIAGHDVGSLGTLSRGNHHVVIGITDHDG